MIILYFLLYALAAAHLYHYYPLLPEKLATHFGDGGVPNGWMPRDTFAGFYAGMLLFMTSVFLLARWLVQKLPDRLINIPNKAYWLAPERREKTRNSYARDLGLMGLFTGAFVIGIHHLLITIALDGQERLDTTQFLCWLGVFLAGVAFFILRQLFRFRMPDDVK